MSRCATERGISVTRFSTANYVGSCGAKGILDLRDCVQGATKIVIAIYILIRHIRRDMRSLPQPRLGPCIVDGNYVSIVPIETVFFVAMRSHGIRALEMKR